MLAVVDAVRAIDPAVALTATLRDGVPDEVGWPALDALAATFGADVETISRYPFLTLRERSRVAFVGPHGVEVDLPDLVSADAILADVRVARGAVFVAYAHRGCTPFFRLADVLGVWSDRPGRTTRFRDVAFGASGICGYLDDGDAVVMGGRRVVPRRRTGPLRRTWSDRQGTWVIDDRLGSLVRVDPRTGDAVDAPLPSLVTAAQAEGVAIDWARSWLTPRLPGAAVAVGERDGVVGGLVVRRPDGEVETWLPDGARIPGARLLALPWPGDGRPRWWIGDGPPHGDRSESGKASLLRADRDAIAFRAAPERPRVRLGGGREDAWAQPTWAAGTPLVAPWFFRPLFVTRDPDGSEALRRVDLSASKRLLDAPRGRASDALKNVLPEVSHPALRTGLLALLGATADAARRLDAVRAAVPAGDEVPAVRRTIVRARLFGAIAGRLAAPSAHAAAFPSVEADLERAVRAGRDVAGVDPADLQGAEAATLWLASSPAWDDDTRLDLVELARALLHGRNDAEAFALRRITNHLAAHGGWRWDRTVAERLAASTGLSVPEATLVVAGLGRHEPPPSALWSLSVIRHDQQGPFGQRLGPAGASSSLGLKPAEARDAHRALADVPEEVWRSVFAAALPSDPGGLAAPFGDDVDDGWVERLAQAWNHTVGRRPAVPADAIPEARLTLGDPFVARHLGWLVDPSGFAPTRWPSDIGRSSGLEPIRGLVRAILWAFVARPVGDPLWRGIPEAIRLARDRLASWPTVTLAWKQDGLDRLGQEREITSIAEVLGARVVPPVDDVGDPVVVRPGFGCGFVQLRPGELDEVDVLDRLVGQLGRPRQDEDRCAVRALRWLMSDESLRLAERVERSPVPVGRWEVDPTASAVDAVRSVQRDHGFDADPAALWLQLHVLPDPSDALIQRTMGWDRSRLEIAVAALVACGALVRDTRRRADRGGFLPGPWVELAAPCRPAEQTRLDVLGVRFPRGIAQPPLWQQVLIDRPVHELFEIAAGEGSGMKDSARRRR